LTEGTAQRGRGNRATTAVRFSHAAIRQVRRAVQKHLEDDNTIGVTDDAVEADGAQSGRGR
jgi:hypothetical protein